MSAAVQKDVSSETLLSSLSAEKKLPFDAVKLESYLTRTLNNFRGPLVVNAPTLEQGSGSHIISSPEGRYRIRHIKSTFSHDELVHLRKEFYILATLHRIGFPVAQPLLLCEETHVIGTPFYIAHYPEGRTFNDAALIGMPKDQRMALYNVMNITLAKLHSFDPGTLGLAPLAQSSSTLASQIKRWENVYNTNRLGEIHEMEELAQWLPEYLPPEQPSKIVHGNYHLNRLVFHPTDAEIIAIRDWDNTSISDPIADAVYHLLAWVVPPSDVSIGRGALKGYNLAELGVPNLRSYMDSYAKITKIGELPYINFYFAYNLFRLAATMQELATQIYMQDAQSPHARLIASQVRPLAILALRFAEKASAR